MCLRILARKQIYVLKRVFKYHTYVRMVMMKQRGEAWV